MKIYQSTLNGVGVVGSLGPNSAIQKSEASQYYTTTILYRGQHQRVLTLEDPPPVTTVPVGPTFRTKYSRYPNNDCLHLNTKDLTVTPPLMQPPISGRPLNDWVPQYGSKYPYVPLLSQYRRMIQYTPPGSIWSKVGPATVTQYWAPIVGASSQAWKAWSPYCLIMRVKAERDPYEYTSVMIFIAQSGTASTWKRYVSTFTLTDYTHADDSVITDFSTSGIWGRVNGSSGFPYYADGLHGCVSAYGKGGVFRGNDLFLAIRSHLLQSFSHADEFDVIDRAISSWNGPDYTWLDNLFGLVELAVGIATLNPVVITDTIVDSITSVKGLSNAFLSWKYGIAPLPNDLASMADQVGHFLKSAFRAGVFKATAREKIQSGDWSGMLSVALRFVPGAPGKQLLANAGISDIFEELWNIVPFSFVADWFLDFGSTLGRLDSQLLYSTYNFKEICVSYKVSRNCASLTVPGLYGYNINGTVSLYERQYRANMPSPNYFQLPDVSNNLRSHWAEGLALIMQRSK